MKYVITLITSCFCVISIAQAAQVLNGRYILNNEAEATTFFNARMKDRKILPRRENQALYQHLHTMNSIIFEQMKKFSKNTTILKPIVLLVREDNNDLSFFYKNSETQKRMSSNLITISASRLQKIKKMAGVLAHEMAHYFLNHGKNQESEEEIITSYFADETDCIDCLASKDKKPKLTQSLLALYDSWGKISNFSSKELNNIPIDPYLNGGDLANILGKMMLHIFESKIISEERSCKDAYNSWVILHNLYINNLDSLNGFINLGPAKKRELDLHSTALISNGKKCFEGRDKVFRNALKEQTGGTYKQIQFLFEPEGEKELEELSEEIQSAYRVIISDKNPIDKIIEITKLVRQDIENLNAKIGNIENLRYLSEEDAADELAAKSLISTPFETGLFEFFEKDGASKEQIKKCKDIIESGAEPFFGPFLSKHHAYCWRLWRTQKITSSFKENLLEGAL